MYKSYFAQHGMHKYNKASDMAFVMRKLRTRDAQGKRSSFVVRSRAVSAKEITRYTERKRGRDQQFQEAPADAPTPPHIQCYSLPPSPSPEGVQDNLMVQEENRTLLSDTVVVPERPRKRKHGMSPTMKAPTGLVRQWVYPFVRERARSPSIPITVTAPEDFVKSELLFMNISNYVCGSFDNGTWFINEDGLLESINMRTGRFVSNRFHTLFFRAVEHLKVFQFVQGYRLASIAFSLLPAMLIAESPTLLSDLIDIFLLLGRSGFVGLCAMLQDHIRQLAEIILPERHVCRQICISLCLENPGHPEMILRNWHCIAGSFSRSIKNFANTGVIHKVDLVHPRPHRNYGYGEVLVSLLFSGYSQRTEGVERPSVKKIIRKRRIC